MLENQQLRINEIYNQIERRTPMAEIQDQNPSSTDAALATVKQELEAARKNLVDLQIKAQVAPGSEKPKAYQAVEEARKKVDEVEAKLNSLSPQPLATSTTPPAAVEPELLAEHKLTADETLSHLALKYYGHATPPYWKVIYEANKELIGDNPNRVRPGMVIKVPALPPDFKG
jgi:nucleoid-associated protein YgaU